VITGTPNALPPRQRADRISVAVKPVPPGKLRAFLSQVTGRRNATGAALPI
jgi:hypothetical protein